MGVGGSHKLVSSSCWWVGTRCPAIVLRVLPHASVLILVCPWYSGGLRLYLVDKSCENGSSHLLSQDVPARGRCLVSGFFRHLQLIKLSLKVILLSTFYWDPQMDGWVPVTHGPRILSQICIIPLTA